MHDVELSVQVIQGLSNVERHLAPPAPAQKKKASADATTAQERAAACLARGTAHVGVCQTPNTRAPHSTAQLRMHHARAHPAPQASLCRVSTFCRAARRLPPFICSIASITSCPCSRGQRGAGTQCMHTEQQSATVAPLMATVEVSPVSQSFV